MSKEFKVDYKDMALLQEALLRMRKSKQEMLGIVGLSKDFIDILNNQLTHISDLLDSIERWFCE